MRFFFLSPRMRLFGGARMGFSLGRQDLRRYENQQVNGQLFDPDHGFIYVVKGDHGRCKIGITGNVAARLSALRTASAFPIEYAWIGAPQGKGVAIERDAHTMLNRYRNNGEWFSVSPDAAVGAICAAAHRLGQAMLEVTPERAEQIRIIALAEAARQPKHYPFFKTRVALMVVSAVILAGLIAILAS